MITVSSKSSPDPGETVSRDDPLVCTVLHPFVAEDKWQVTVQTSDVIYVGSRLKTGWWFVHKVRIPLAEANVRFWRLEKTQKTLGC